MCARSTASLPCRRKARRWRSSANRAAASPRVGRLVLRLIEPSAGTVRFEGDDLLALDRRRDARAPAPPAADLPGPLRQPRPAHDGRRHAGASRCACTTSCARGAAARPRRRAARAGRPAPGPRAALSARILRRPAPAHRHRPRARRRAEADHRRRAGLGARRLDPGAGDQPAEATAAAPRPGLRLHQPRSRGRAAHRRPRRGDVSRQDRRDGDDRRAVRRSPRHPYTRALLSAVPVPDPTAVRERGAARGRHARAPIAPAAGLPLPHPLPLRGGQLPRTTPRRWPTTAPAIATACPSVARPAAGGRIRSPRRMAGRGSATGCAACRRRSCSTTTGGNMNEDMRVSVAGARSPLRMARQRAGADQPAHRPARGPRHARPHAGAHLCRAHRLRRRSATSCSTSTRSSTIVPQLALSHETSADGKTVTIKLRAGVKFHDGEPLDAEACAIQPRPPPHHEGLLPPPEIGSVDKRRGRRSADHQAHPQGAVLAAPRPAHRPRRHDGVAQGRRGRGRQVRHHPVCAGPYNFVERVAQDRIVVEKLRRLLERGPGPHRPRSPTCRSPTTRCGWPTCDPAPRPDRAHAAPTDIKTVRADPKLKLVEAVELGYQGITINLGNGAAANTPLGHDAARPPRLRARASTATRINQVVYQRRVSRRGNQWVRPHNPYHVSRTSGPSARRRQGQGAAAGGRRHDAARRSS